MTKCFQIRVRGKVQGVFFRASAKQRAEELGIKGFVRNESDGSVYIEAEGEQSLLSDLVEWCKRGPSSAHVEQCEVSDLPLQNFKGFEIRR